MKLSRRTEAIMLLTLHLPGRGRDIPTPLSPGEWNWLADWLHRNALSPESLLLGNPWAILATIDEPKVEPDRILGLLEREALLHQAVERWTDQKIWVLNRGEAAYPPLLKERLGWKSPPLLFGCGDVTLATRKAVAIIGSRNATRHDRDVAYRLGQKVVDAGYTVVSGGARGIDECAVDGAVQHGGMAVAVLPALLTRYAKKTTFRPHLEAGRLLFVTPYSPDAGFDAGNAIGRNKLIYCLAVTAIAVCSTNGTGGTFRGAIENVTKPWGVPLWVAKSDDPESGNPALVEAGARWMPPMDDLVVDDLTPPAATTIPAVGDNQVA